MRPALLLLLLGSSMMVFAQGTVRFTNFDPNFSLDSPVFGGDCVTRLSGPEWQATLLAWDSPVATTPFLAGNSAGYFDGGVVTLPNVLPYSTLFGKIEIWNTNAGASFEEAQSSGLPNAWGLSPTFMMSTGNDETNAPPLYAFQWSLRTIPLDPPAKTTLTMFLTSTNMVAISWDSSYAAFCNLQQNPDPGSTNWTWVSATPQPLSCYKVGLILPVPSSQMFYRLASFYTWP